VFAADLKEIVRRGRRFGAQVVFLNNNHPTCRDTEVIPGADLTYEESNRRYNQIVREVAGQLGEEVTFNDVELQFKQAIAAGADRTRLLLPDGLHLSREGHELYFSFLAPIIRDAVASLAASSQRAGK
jgi:lysophospholipase L1-like esterase